jgi:hypothetical protein
MRIENGKLKIEKSDREPAGTVFNFQFSIFNFFGRQGLSG